MTSTNQFDSAGDERNPPIVLVHGVASNRKSFLPQTLALSDAFHMLVPDLPGHGMLAGQRFSFSACIPVIDEVIRVAGGRALLAGSSMGAYAALTYAAHEPERVAGLVLSGCGIDFSDGLAPAARGFAGFIRIARPLMLPTMRAFSAWTMRRIAGDVAGEIKAAGYFYDGWSDSYRDLAALHAYDLMRAYPGPTLILNGSFDFHRPFQNKLAAAAQHARVQMIAGATHFPNLEQPQRYNQAVRDFAASIGWGAFGSPQTDRDVPT